MIWRDIAKAADKIIFPPFCLNCRKETPEEPPALRWLCLECHRSLAPRWQKTSLKPEIEEAYFAFDYQKDKLAQKIIRALKYDWVKDMADTLAVALEKERLNFKKLAARDRIDSVAPIPLHWRRLRERGFNQSALIAKKVAELTGRPIAENLLKRKQNRRPQAGIENRGGRIKNAANMFAAVKPDCLDGKTILLVDDVATTGATLRQAALTLRRAGARRIFSFALAQD